jgi:RHS repeat-associated protein
MMIQIKKMIAVVMLSIIAYTGYSQCGVAPSITAGSRCGVGSVVLSATSATAGTFRWYNIATGGTALQTSASGTSNSYTTASLSTTTTYYVTFHNGTCESSPRTAIVATVNTIPSAPTIVAGSRCAAGTVTLTANSSTAGIFKWYSASTGGTLLQASAAGLTTNSYTTPSLSATTTYYVSLTNSSNCESGTRTAVTATVNAIPSAPTVTAGSTCGAGVVVLAANSSTAGTFKWYSASTGGTLLQTSTAGLTTNNYTTPSLSATTTYYVSYTNSSNCESATRTAVTATVNAMPSAPTITAGSRCGAGSVVLSASTATAGTFRWYSVSTGGSALQISASGTSNSYTTGSLSATTTYYVTFHNGTCESSPRTAIVATVNTFPSAPTIVAGSRCAAGTVTLTANSSTAGIFKWYSASTGGTLLQASAAGLTTNSYTTPSLSATTTYYVSLTNSSNCESGTRTAVKATVNAVPSAPTVTAGSTCGAGAVVLAANSSTAGTFKWYSASTGGTLLQTSTAGLTTNNYTTPSLSTTTTYYVSYTNSSNCESATRTAVTATVNANTPASSPSVTNGSRCGTGTVSLSASSTTAGTFRWYTTLTGGTLLQTSASATSNTYTTPSISASTTYYVTFHNGTCESTPRKAVIATVNPLATAPTPVAASRCGTGTVALAASSATAGTFKWYTALTGGTLLRTSTVGVTTDNYTTASLTGTTTYYVTFSTSTCESTPRTAITATVNAIPTAPTVTAGSRCGTGTVTVTANSSTAGTFKWYSASTGGTLLQTSPAGLTTNTYTTPSLSATTTYYVSLTNSSNCESTTRTAVAATITPFPSLFDVSGGCSYTPTVPASLMLNGSETGINYQLLLNGVNSGTAIAGTGYTLSWSVSAEGTYTVQATQGNCSAMMNKSAKVESLQNYVFNEFAFLYKYDSRRRMSHKKVPGADWVYMVYDNRDRLVMTQDGNQRIQNQWTFTKYDVLNRPVMTGIYTHGSSIDQVAMQGVVNSYYNNLATNNGNWHETFSSTGAVHGYDNKSFPVVSDVNQYLTVTYYDDYTYKALYTNDPANDYRPNQLEAKTTSAGTTYNQVSWNQLVKGQLTGTKTRILGSTTFLLSVVYYDDKYRTIQTIVDNHKGGKDCHTTMYDFAGNVLATNTTHSIPSQSERKVIRTYDYDHVGRLLKTWQKIDGESTILVSKNEYNEIGEIVSKGLHSTNQGTSFKQQVDYRYNIRGWLSRINNSDLSNSDGGPKDYFGMEFGYNNDLGVGDFTPQFNGNISAAKWSANLGLGLPYLNEPTERAYKYSYDALNRLVSADFAIKNLSWKVTNGNKEEIEYDLNGNILSLLRTSNSGGVLDWLTYKYGNGNCSSKGNRLFSVSDNGYLQSGFKDNNTVDNDYEYDANGNLIVDKNKRLSSIKYDSYLNQANEFVKSNGERVKYIYNAEGIRLGEEIYSASSATASKKTDYIGSFIYANDTLKQIVQAEGKIVVPKVVSDGLEYQYTIKDHIGNTRLTFTTKTKKDELKATMEDTGVADFNNPRVQEMAHFGNLFETEIKNVNQWLNHTSSQTGNAIYLDGSSSRTVGPYSMLKVYPGDTIKIQAYAKFETQSSHASMPIATIVASLLSPIQSAAFPFDGGKLFSATNTSGSLTSLFANKTNSTAVPNAYLNYILFDKNFNVIDMGYDKIDQSAGFATYQENMVAFDHLQIERIIDRVGYFYAYVSNESPGSRVWMDDFQITYSKSPIVQFEDYYPFGLSISETAFDRENPDYQGMVTTEGLGLKDLGFRQLDPALGRFHAVDPLAELQMDNSTYQYAANDPVNQIDLLGLEADSPGEGDGRVKQKRGYSRYERRTQRKEQREKRREARKAEREKRREERKEQREKKEKEKEKKEEKQNQNNNSGNPYTSDRKSDKVRDNFPEKSDEENSLLNQLSPTGSDRNSGRDGLGRRRLGNAFFNVQSSNRGIEFQAVQRQRERLEDMQRLPLPIADAANLDQNDNDQEQSRQTVYGHITLIESRALYQRAIASSNTDTRAIWNMKENVAAINEENSADDLTDPKMDPPKKSTPEQALEVIPETIPQSEHFPNVSPDEFLSQLRERVSSGGYLKTNQGFETNFCWAGSIVMKVYQNDPKGMAEAMIGLYKNGTFVYDNNNDGMNVPKPSQEVRDAIGSSVFDDNQNDDEGKTINEIDQMLFMTLADATKYKGFTNVDKNYDAHDEEDPTWSGKVLLKAVEIWKDFGYDVDAMGVNVGGWIKNTPKVNLVKDAMKTTDVVLFVNSGAFKDGSYLNLWATHYIHVLSIQEISDNDPMTIDMIEIKYWDYGEPKTVQMYPEQFSRSVYGIIQIPKK